MTSHVDELRSKANDAFSEEHYLEAIDLYTQAIALDKKNHCLYSNRSAAYVKSHKYEEALKDADKCLKLKPDFIKGYSRKGAALLYLKRYGEAISAYEEGLKIDPNNDVLLSDLETARKQAASPSKPSNNNPTSSVSIFVCKGDLLTQKTDVIVVCSSSKFLLEKVCEAGGNSVLTSFKAQYKNSQDTVISVKADGRIIAKQIYFIAWSTSEDTSTLCKSLEKFVSDALKMAAQQNYQSIAFPAIGCGVFECPVDLVARSMIREVYRRQQTYNIAVTFVIEPSKDDIFIEFQEQLQLLKKEILPNDLKTVSANVKRGMIEVEQADITRQKVDVIIGSSSSGFLRQAILKAAGDSVRQAYEKELRTHANSTLIAVSGGALPCKQIFFVNWEPDENEEVLRQFTSIAFPAIGCGQHGCSTDVVIHTMVLEIKTHLMKRDLSWKVKFIIEPGQDNIYDEFRKEVLTTQDGLHESKSYKLPPTWVKPTGHNMRYTVPSTTNEYKSILSNFDQTMKGNYSEIIRIERIQNERWYKQYTAHCEDFLKRLETDTEKRLYHGCPDKAADSIIEDCFNRSFAGVNGTAYGFGVYFSSNAAYSHGFTRPNENGEHCMFIARVLIGKTTKGNSSMKTRPIGFDSTTDENHIFVTYHDAQAYAEYLISYK